jgi:hypothetical protein
METSWQEAPSFFRRWAVLHLLPAVAMMSPLPRSLGGFCVCPPSPCSPCSSVSSCLAAHARALEGVLERDAVALEGVFDLALEGVLDLAGLVGSLLRALLGVFEREGVLDLAGFSSVFLAGVLDLVEAVFSTAAAAFLGVGAACGGGGQVQVFVASGGE